MVLENNYAFIDSQNLHLGILSLGWKLDYQRFRIYLKKKYGVSKAFLFIGYIKENEWLYEKLKKAGFELIFKPVLSGDSGKPKGNVDAELVLQTMIEINNFNKAVIITGDGDFNCLIKYLQNKNKLAKILIPNQNECSSLLKKVPSEYLAYVSYLKEILQKTKKELPKEEL